MSLVSKKFWYKKKVLITGINGFVGSHLAVELEKRGAIVWGVSKSSKRKQVIKANIIDYSRIDEIISKKNIDICFHLAAESLVEAGQADPYQTFKTNMLGTLNILESTRKNNLERLIIASTSHVYGDNPLPLKEEYPAKPSRPYETSKACIDMIAQSYADTFNLPVVISRFSNIYGPGDMNFNRLIPKTIKSILTNKSPQMWGGDAVREYVYIDDAIDGYLKLASFPTRLIEKNRIYNFGSVNRLSVRDVIERIIKITKVDLKIEKIDDVRTFEIGKQYVSSAKARRILKWSPKVSMEEGLIKVFEWYSEYFKKLNE